MFPKPGVNAPGGGKPWPPCGGMFGGMADDMFWGGVIEEDGCGAEEGGCDCDMGGLAPIMPKGHAALVSCCWWMLVVSFASG